MGGWCVYSLEALTSMFTSRSRRQFLTGKRSSPGSGERIWIAERYPSCWCLTNRERNARRAAEGGSAHSAVTTTRRASRQAISGPEASLVACVRTTCRRKFSSPPSPPTSDKEPAPHAPPRCEPTAPLGWRDPQQPGTTSAAEGRCRGGRRGRRSPPSTRLAVTCRGGAAERRRYDALRGPAGRAGGLRGRTVTGDDDGRKREVRFERRVERRPSTRRQQP